MDGFKVTHRSVRERFEKMMRDFDKKENEEKKASGVDVEYTEIQRALGDIKGRIAEVEEVHETERAKENKDKATGEKMSQKAMETLGETKKRSKSEGSNTDVDDDDDDEVIITPRRKKARSTSSMTDILGEAINSRKESNEIKNKELDLRKEETKQQHLFQQNLLQQQQQIQQQQQAMNMAMLNAMQELVKKIK